MKITREQWELEREGFKLPTEVDDSNNVKKIALSKAILDEADFIYEEDEEREGVFVQTKAPDDATYPTEANFMTLNKMLEGSNIKIIIIGKYKAFVRFNYEERDYTIDPVS